MCQPYVLSKSSLSVERVLMGGVFPQVTKYGPKCGTEEQESRVRTERNHQAGRGKPGFTGLTSFRVVYLPISV